MSCTIHSRPCPLPPCRSAPRTLPRPRRPTPQTRSFPRSPPAPTGCCKTPAPPRPSPARNCRSSRSPPAPLHDSQCTQSPGPRRRSSPSSSLPQAVTSPRAQPLRSTPHRASPHPDRFPPIPDPMPASITVGLFCSRPAVARNFATSLTLMLLLPAIAIETPAPSVPAPYNGFKS